MSGHFCTLEMFFVIFVAPKATSKLNLPKGPLMGCAIKLFHGKEFAPELWWWWLWQTRGACCWHVGTSWFLIGIFCSVEHQLSDYNHYEDEDNEEFVDIPPPPGLIMAMAMRMPIAIPIWLKASKCKEDEKSLMYVLSSTKGNIQKWKKVNFVATD